MTIKHAQKIISMLYLYRKMKQALLINSIEAEFIKHDMMILRNEIQHELKT